MIRAARTRNFLPFVTLLALAAPLLADETPLTTTFASGNGQDGNMFDVTAKRTIRVTRLDAHFDSGNATVEIYALQGGVAGKQGAPGAWTLVGSAAVVGGGDVSAGGAPTPIPIAIDLEIAAGETWGFYVTNTGGADASINYTNGSQTGAVFVEDSDVQIREGLGVAYPFGTTYAPRVWNGTLYYEPAGLTGTPGALSVGLGGSQVLSLDLGSAHASKSYLVLGSLSGTAPGVAYSGLVVPLNPDAYLFHTLQNPNTPLLNGSAGTLNSSGASTAVFSLPAGGDPALTGLTVHHAALVIEPRAGTLAVTAVTDAVPLTLTP